MAAGEIRKDLKRWKSDECLGDDSGLLKAKVFHLFGLGEPPKKVWTKAGAVFMLDRRGATYTDGEVSTKKDAVATLERVIYEDGAADTETDETNTISKQLFKTPQQKEKRRAELIDELNQLGGTKHGEKRKRAEADVEDVTDHKWGQAMTREARMQLAGIFLRENE